MKESFKKILIIRLSSLGDILLTYPLIKLIKDKYPYTLVDFLVKEQFLDAVKTNIFLNEIIPYRKENSSEVKKLIKNRSYDAIIDLQNNFRSRMLYFNSISKVYKFQKPTLKKFLLVHTKLNFLKNNESIAVHYIKTFFPNAKTNHLPIYFNLPDEMESKAKEIFESKFENKNVIGIIPGARHFTKRYPVELFIEIIKELIKRNYNISIFGGSDDELICKELEIDKNKTKNFQNNNDLLMTASLMKNCKGIISNDSGLMHLASLLQIPTIAIFGSTVKEFGFFPIFNKSIIVENSELKCRPCSHIGKSKCPENHFKCMKDISPLFIVDKLEELIHEI